MTIDPELLAILVCPQSKTPLLLGEPALVEEINRRISAGTCTNRAGTPVTDQVADLLVREDRNLAYPVRDGIPVLLIDEAISLNQT